jgi:HEAT repeat protein
MAEKAKPVSGKAFERLSDLLKNGIDVHRCAAARSLGMIKYPGSAEILKEALLDEDEDVRADVVGALKEIGEAATGEAVLENLLGDPCPEVKLTAIEMLGEINHREAVPWLLKLITEQTEEINWDGDAYYSSGWDDWLDIQRAAIRAVGEMGASEAVPEILKAMDDEEGQDLSPVAIPALARLGEDGLAALKKLFGDPDSRIRRRICKTLDFGRAKTADNILNAALLDEAGDVRLEAVEKLIEHDMADERLLDFFEDDDADVRRVIVDQLGKENPARVMAALTDESPDVRQVAFRVIANAPDKFEKEGFAEIVRQAIAGVPEVAGDAGVAWACLIGAPSARSLGEALQNPKQPLAFRMGLIEALTLLDDDGFPFLAETAGDENRQVRVRALTALAEIARETPWPNNASQTLLAALNGELVEPPVEGQEGEARPETGEEPDQTGAESGELVQEQTELEEQDQQAVSTLEQIMRTGLKTEEAADDGPEEVVELDEEDERFIEISKLRAMKKGKVSLDVKIAPHQDVRRFAARLLGDFNEPGLDVTLAEALAGEDDELKQSVLESLSLIGEETGGLSGDVYAAIYAETEHPDRSIRMYAARSMGFLDSSEATGCLVEMSKDSDVHVRMEAIRGLARKTGNEGVLQTALDDEYSGVRSVAAKGLAKAKVGMDELVALTLLHDGMHRREVIESIAEWNRYEAAEKFLDIVESEDKKRVWLIAITAIGELLEQTSDRQAQAVA